MGLSTRRRAARSTRVVARSFGNLIDVFGGGRRARSDTEALISDWEHLGDDMRRAYSRIIERRLPQTP